MKKLILLLTVLSVTSFTGQRAYGENVFNLKLGSDSSTYSYAGATGESSVQNWTTLDMAGGYDVLNLPYAVGDKKSSVSVSYFMGGSDSTESSAFIDMNNQPLMLGTLSNDDTTTGTFEFSGLAPGMYKIYVYSQWATGLPSTLSFSTWTSVDHSDFFTFSNDGSLTGFKQANKDDTNGNYAVATIVVGSTVTTHDNFAEVPVPTNYNFVLSVGPNSMINGIQIQAVPEPGSVILLGVGGVFIFSIKRMRVKDGWAEKV